MKLSPVTKSLCGPNRKPLNVICRLNATLSSTNHQCDHEVYVIQQLKHNLLDLPAIKELHLLTQIDHISLNHSSIINQYPKIFTGLGTFKKILKSPSNQMQNHLQYTHPERFLYHSIRKCRMISLNGISWYHIQG